MTSMTTVRFEEAWRMPKIGAVPALGGLATSPRLADDEDIEPEGGGELEDDEFEDDDLDDLDEEFEDEDFDDFDEEEDFEEDEDFEEEDEDAEEGEDEDEDEEL